MSWLPLILTGIGGRALLPRPDTPVKRKGAEAPFQGYGWYGLRLPLMPVMPVMPTPATVVVPVPMVPAPVTVVMRVPVMPTVSPATMPAPTTPVMRVVVTVAVTRLVPAVAPPVADVSGLLNVGSLRGLTRNSDRHRRGSCGRECNTAKCGEADKCRNKFHDISPPNACWRRAPGNRFVALRRFNTDERLPALFAMKPARLCPPVRGPSAHAACFPIRNQAVSNGASIAVHQLRKDGGFDENNVMVAVSLSVVVFPAYAPALRWSVARKIVAIRGRSVAATEKVLL
jgi:hypothetical protein